MAVLLKFLVLGVLIALALWWFAGGARRVTQRKHDPLPGPEGMLRCAHCGVHLPASESVRDAQGRTYCSAAHREAGPRDADAP